MHRRDAEAQRNAEFIPVFLYAPFNLRVVFAFSAPLRCNNRLTHRGIMAAYPCPTRPEDARPGDEPCTPDNPSLFRPNQNATRGQLAKIASNAAGYNEAVSGQFYADVLPGDPFYTWIMRLTSRGVMSGYTCGGPGEECDGQNRPYFRPGNEVTRGQAAKIVSNTFFPECRTP